MSTEVIELGELNTNIGESISLNTSALPNNDTPTRSANFGLGAELLMNEKKKDGGNTPTSAQDIFTITMATKGDATDYDDLNASPSQLPQIGTVANSNKAIVAGGTSGSGQNVIQSFSMATTGQSADFGDLTVGRYAAGGVSDSHGGLLE